MPSCSVGCPSPGLNSPEQISSPRSIPPHQYSWTRGSLLHLPLLPTQQERPFCQSAALLSSIYLQYKSSEESKIPVLMCRVNKAVDVVHIPSHRHLSDLTTSPSKCRSSLPEQTLWPRPGVGTQCFSLSEHVSLGHSRSRSLCNIVQCKVVLLLLKRRLQSQFDGECHPHPLALYPLVCLPSNAIDPQVSEQAKARRSCNYPDSTILAKESGVLGSALPPYGCLFTFLSQKLSWHRNQAL